MTTETTLVCVFSQTEQAAMADAIHYPRCWDTAAYPTLACAIYEAVANAKCSECNSIPDAGAYFS